MACDKLKVRKKCLRAVQGQHLLSLPQGEPFDIQRVHIILTSVGFLKCDKFSSAHIYFEKEMSAVQPASSFIPAVVNYHAAQGEPSDIHKVH